MNEVQSCHVFKRNMHSQKHSSLLILNNSNDSNYFVNKVQIIFLIVCYHFLNILFDFLKVASFVEKNLE